MENIVILVLSYIVGYLHPNLQGGKVTSMNITEFASLGGKARSKKYTKEQLSAWGKKGGRPKGKKLTKFKKLRASDIWG